MESSSPPTAPGFSGQPPVGLIDRDYRVELIRKAIHFCSLSIPILYFYLPRSVALTLSIPVTVAFLAVDIARYRFGPVEQWFYRTFGWLLRRHESDRAKRRLNGATYVLIAATICILIFPKLVAVTSIAVLIISDITSALVGRRYGKHRFLGKTLEGSAAFFLSAVVVIALTPKIEYTSGEYIVGILSAAAGTVVEALPVRLDDNITVPLSVGAILWIGYLLFLPGLNIYKFG